MSGSSGREHSVELRVPFHDTDAMQVVWHGNYLKYFEHARDALLEASGIDLYSYAAESGYLFPIIRTWTKHIRPLRCNDRFLCRARVTDCRRKLAMDFEIRRVEDDVLCARGGSEQVAVRRDELTLLIAIPDAIREALEFP